jgi:hypothetical protein
VPWQVVICNRTHHAVTFLDQWAGTAGWETVTLAAGQDMTRTRIGMAQPLEVLYQVKRGHGLHERLAVLSPSSSFEQPWVYSFRPGSGGKVNLF